jgi:hypothetical protein
MLERLVAALLFCAALPASAASVTSTWIGGTGSWTDPIGWSAGVPQNTTADSFDAVIDGGNPVASNVTLDSAATIGSLHVDAGDALVLTPTGQLTLDGNQIENAGEIALHGIADSYGTPSTSLVLSAPNTVLSGGGSIRLDDAQIFPSDYSSSLTNMDNRIAGWGMIWDFANYGLLEADVAGRGLYVYAGDNYGTVRAVGGGILGLSSGPSFINHGTIEALDGSEVDSPDFFISEGGTITALRHSTMHLSGGFVNTRFETDANSQITLGVGADHGELDGVTLDGQIVLDGANMSGTITNLGSIRASDIEAFGPTTLVNQGQILLQYVEPNSNVLSFAGGGDVTLDATNSDNAFPLSRPIRNVDNEMRGTGSLQLLQNGGLVQASSGVLTIFGSALDHAGVFAAAPGGTLEMAATTATGSGSWRADGGLIHVTGDVETTGDIAVVHGGSLAVDTTMSGGNLIVDDTGLLDIQGALHVAGSVDFDGPNAGRWLFAPDASLEANRGGGAAVGSWGGWQFFEASGRDLGLVAAGFTNDNFYLPELVISADGRFVLRDLRDNGNHSGDGHEAVYVDTLVFSDSLGLLNLNGIDLYYNHLVGSLDQIINVAVPEPSSVLLFGLATLGLGVARLRHRGESRD